MSGFLPFAGALAGLGVVLLVLGLRGVEAGSQGVRAITKERRRDLSVRVGLAAVFGLGLLALTGWPVTAVLGVFLGVFLPRLVTGRGEEKRAEARVEAIATFAEQLRDTTAGGVGVTGAIAAVAPRAPGPIRKEVGALAARLAAGEAPGSALAAFASEVGDPMADLVAAALSIGTTEQSGRLGELLSALAASARDQVAMRLRVEVGRARTRATARAVTWISLVAVVGLLVFDRHFLAPYSTAVGEVVLSLVGACFAGSYVLLARIGRDQSSPRFLLAAQEEER
ncbi:MAG: type II secretion system F family protein [Acidimicrobiales bacterium]